MRIIKPNFVSPVVRPFEHRRRIRLGVGALAAFPLQQSDRLLDEQTLWTRVMSLETPPVLDVGIPKPEKEWLLLGHAHAPGGARVTHIPVQVELGAMERTLYAVGDRRWQNEVPTDPEPFHTMPLTWERAFGGPGFEPNPLGRGMPAAGGPEGAPRPPPSHRVGGEAPTYLPNLEAPGTMLRSPKERPEPTCFGPIDVTWPPRKALLGTYGDDYLTTDYPGFAADLDPRFFNLAAPAQRAPGSFVGDERFRLTHVHPDHTRVEGRLPGIAARAFLSRGRPDAPLEELAMRLTTVWFLPDVDLGVLVFHGLADIEEDDAYDVVLLLLALERVGAPREAGHYETLRRTWLGDRTRAADILMTGRGLVPDELLLESPLAALEAARSDNDVEDRIDRAKAKRTAEMAAALRAEGTDEDDIGLSRMDAITQSEKPAEVRELEAEIQKPIAQLDVGAMRRKLEAVHAAMQARIDTQKASFEKNRHVDIEESAPARTSGPRVHTGELREQLSTLAEETRASGAADAQLEAATADPKTQEGMDSLDAIAQEGYRRTVYYDEPLGELSLEEARALGDALVARLEAREPVAGMDFSRANLAGRSLAGYRLVGVFLESACLDGCDLSDTDFTEAVLTRASLEHATLDGASLENANLGGARLDGAHARRPVRLRGAFLAGASLRRAALPGSELSEADLSEADLSEADLSESRGEKLLFRATRLVGTRFDGAVLPRAVFIEADATELQARGANLAGAMFLRTSLQRAQLERATLTKLVLVDGCDASDIHLEGADLTFANLRCAVLARAQLRDAKLDGADLSEARLDDADLIEVRARDSRWTRAELVYAALRGADLMNADFGKALLHGTDLRGASLYGADFARVRSAGEVQLAGADQTHVRTHPRRS